MSARWIAVLAACALGTAPSIAWAQAGVPTMSFSQYLEGVLERNLDLSAARSDASAARARVQTAARLPDPRLWGGVSQVDVSGAGFPLATILQLDVPVELGNRQGARMDVARVGVRQADAGIDDRTRTLRAEAAHAWIDALAARRARERLRHTLESLEQLVAATEAGVHAGAMSDVALTQTRVQAQLFRAQVLAAQGEARASVIGLAALLGDDDAAEPAFDPAGSLAIPARDFELAVLLDRAIENRPDLRVRELDVEAGQREQALAEADRWGDVTFSVNWLYSADARASQFMQSEYHTLGFFVGVPLPFRLQWRGEIDEALAHQEAADARYRAARRRLEVELRQALARYEAAVEAAGLFDTAVLADADRALEAVRYQYQRGGATLVEVLAAQRTADDVYRAYDAAQAAHAHALVDVETAAGIWDLDFE